MLQDARCATVKSGCSVAYCTAGHKDAKRAILLIHGYPQTMYSMRYLLDGFAGEGFFAVAADYRGAGGSSITASGYDKVTMAGDLHSLMHDVLGRKYYIILGHDIGSMVATAQAFAFRDSVEALIMMECPQPGTSQYHESVTDRDVTMDLTFHFFFHNAPDLPEQHTQGREAIYLQHFFDRLAYKPYFITAEERQVYFDAFARAGRMKAGFEVYRAFRKDDQDIKDMLSARGKLRCPVLATGGVHSYFTSKIKGMADELAHEVKFVQIEEASHWVPEENPSDLVKEVVNFLQSTLAC